MTVAMTPPTTMTTTPTLTTLAKPTTMTTKTTTTTTMTTAGAKRKRTAAAVVPAVAKTDRFCIFPRASTTLISCTSNSGKTWFVRQVLLNRRVFIEDGENVRRVVYINCNERDAHFSHPWEAEEEKRDKEEEEDDDSDDDSDSDPDEDDDDKDYKDKDNSAGDDDEDNENLIDLVSMGLPELAAAGDGEGLTNLFSPGDVVILDDLQTLTKSVEHLINYGAHHYQLVVFVVTQTCLGSPLYSLLKLVHNVVLLFANNSASNLARHIKNALFLSADTREYLGRIFAQAEKNKSTVVLKINSVATSATHRSVLAFSGVEGLFCRRRRQRRRRRPSHQTATLGTEEKDGTVVAVTDTAADDDDDTEDERRPRPALSPRFCAVYPETKYREDMLRGSQR